MNMNFKNFNRFFLIAFFGATVLGIIEFSLLLFWDPDHFIYRGHSIQFKIGILCLHYVINIFSSVLFISLLRIKGRFIKGIGILICSIFLVEYVISWKLYNLLGFFLDLEGLRFFLQGPTQVIQHIIQFNGNDLIFVVIFILLAPVFIIFIIKKSVDYLFTVTMPANINLTFSYICLLSFVCCAVMVTNVFSAKKFDILKMVKHDLSPQAALFIDMILYQNKVKTIPSESYLNIVWQEQKKLEEFIRETKSHIIKKSVFLFVIESLRSDVLHNNKIMPHLYALSTDSLFFPNAFSSSTHSDYADIAILSSQYPLRSDRHFYMPESSEGISFPRVLIYDVLKAHGFSTAIFSAQNENWGKMRSYLDTGNLDIFFDSTSDTNISNHLTDSRGFRRWLELSKNVGKIDDGIVIDNAIDWVSQRSQENIFLYVNLQRSHFPYTWPETYAPPFMPYEINFRLVFGNYSPSKVSVMKNRYYNALSYVDEQIGRFVQFLKDQKIYEESIIIVTGDTGQAFYEHDNAVHAGALYNEVVRVPLVIKTPGSKHRMIITDFVKHIDIPPTICNLLNIKPHPAFQGSSIIQNDAANLNDPIFITVQTSKAQQDAIIWNKWKLIKDNYQNKIFLFDLENDLNEKKNIADEEKDIAQILQKRLSTWRNTQINYYSDQNQFQKYYPPRYLKGHIGEKD